AVADGDVAAAAADQEDVRAGAIGGPAELLGEGLAGIKLQRQRAVIIGRDLKHISGAEPDAGDFGHADAGEVDLVAVGKAADDRHRHRDAVDLKLAAGALKRNRPDFGHTAVEIESTA